ncbi:PAS domain-containing sensor histidine kinase [Pseudomonadota bacterium]
MAMQSKIKVLLAVGAVMFSVMVIYELAKQFLFPDITIWQSHSVTVLISTMIAMVCATVLYDKFKQTQDSHTDVDQALRISEERFVKSQMYANIGTWEWNIQTGELYWSEQIAPLFGYERGQVDTTYENFVAAVHPDDRERVTGLVQACVENPDLKYEIDHRVVWRDGTVRWLHEKGDVVLGEDGTPLKMLGVVSDIHDRKIVEQRLQESQSNLAEAQRIAKLGSWSNNLKTGAAKWSDERYRIFGFEPGSVEPHLNSLEDSLHPDDRHRVMSAVRKAAETGARLDIEGRIVRPDGEEAAIHILGEVGEDPASGEEVMTGTVMDISERIRAESSLRKLSRALEQSPSAVFITDTRGAIEYVNPKFTTLMGYTPEEAIGENPRILKSAETPAEVHADIWATITSGEEWRGELKDTHKNGSAFWVYATIAPIKNCRGEITHYVATHEDISERKSAEMAVQSALKDADVANRAKSELLANMSHELRTPLNAIIGFSSTIKQEVFGPIGNEKYLEYIGDISSSGQHLLELINDILDVSAIEAGKLELYEGNVDLGKLVKDSVRLVLHRADDGGVGIVTQVSDDLPNMFADERRMKQILLNLMSNAVKFTAEEGTVTLSVAPNADEGLQITVADTGIGMDKIELSKAMTEFGQVGRGDVAKHEGTGLGLPLTKGLVELHNGSMEIASEKGVGTTVALHFPKDRVSGVSQRSQVS